MPEHVEAGSKAIDTINFASTIVAAYVSRNSIPASELPNLVKSVHETIVGLTGGHAEQSGMASQKPAVPVKRSITPDYIVCLEDGKKLKMLKRYLRSNYELSPEQYRAKWGLPRDYPMVAPNYSSQRSQFAKNIGLGRTKKTPASSKRRKAA
jgi:predicted transcriptional regulator